MQKSLIVEVHPTFAKVAGAFQNLDVRSKLRNAITEYALAVEREAKLRTPVDTGRLRASIGTSLGLGAEIQAFVSTNTNYAVYVHQGTKFMRARPFFVWAVDRVRTSELAGIIREELLASFRKI